MSQDFTPSSVVHHITAEEIEHRPFAPVKKGGIDEAAVRSFLREVAAFVDQQDGQMRAREDALERQISQLRQELEHPPVPTGQKLVELVGDEVSRTLRTAQESADEMRAKAEERALRIVRDAQDEAHRIRDEHLEQANQNARAIVESARERGREMVGEARALRERVLADLNRRREALQEQLQELRAGREELAATYRTLKQTFDETAVSFARFESSRPFDAVTIDVPPPPLLPPERPEPIEPRPEARAGALELGELPSSERDAEPAVAEVEVAEPEVAEADAVEPAPPVPEPEPAAEEAAGPPDRDSTAEVSVPTPPAPPPPPEPRPAPPSPPPATPAVEPSPGSSTPDLDEIFKRIRAGRVGDPDARPAEKPPRTDHGPGNGPEASAGGGVATATALATEPVSGSPTRTLTIAPEAAPDQSPDSSADALALAARDELLAPVAVEVARGSKRALQDEQNELLDNLRRQRRGASLEKVLPPLVDQVATWSEVLSPSLDRVYVEARATAAGERPAVTAAPRRLVAAMAEALVSPLRDRVTAVVTDSTDPDHDAIAHRIGARYREWKGQELEARIGDILAATYARGIYDAAPEGARLRWIPAEQGRCSDCDDNALEPTLRGNRFPTGQPFPPAHPGCRCLLEVMR